MINLRQSATHCGIPYDNSASIKQFMSRTMHFATCDMTQLAAGWSNYIVKGAAVEESGSGSVMAIQYQVEYKGVIIGTGSFNGQTTGVCQSGDNITSDIITLTTQIIKGSHFAITSYITFSGSSVFRRTGRHRVGTGVDTWGEYCVYSTGAMTNTLGTVQNNVTSTDVNAHTSPSHIVSYTESDAVMILGDARSTALTPSVPPYPDATIALSGVGELVNGISAGWINGGSPTSGLGNVANVLNFAKRIELSKYVNKLYLFLGSRDLGLNSVTAVTAAANLKTLAALFDVGAVYTGTIPPITSALDGLSGTNANDAQRIIFNTTLRAGINDFVVFDFAKLVESNITPGIWQAGMTIDGITESIAALSLLQSKYCPDNRVI